MKDTTAEQGAEVTGRFLGGTASILFRAYIAMLLLGAVHSHHAEVPAIGYGLTVVLVVVVQMLTYQSDAVK